jgi:4-carboxymuconolactone decarboxylase
MKNQHRERLPDVPDPPRFPRHPGGSASPGRAEVVSADDRHARGLRALTDMGGESAGAAVDALRDIAPDFADWIVDFSYGDVLSRPGLDRRTRQLATIAALTALGNAQPQLRLHIEGALDAGCHPQQIIEVILQTAVHAGFPAAINALTVAREAITSTGPAPQI